MARRYWLIKTDPDTFSWDDLVRSPDATTAWDGVRNYQARNFLRDDVRIGDLVLLYHSQSEKAAVGIARVVRAGYPDPTQFDPRSEGRDPGSDPADPRWYAIDLRAERPLRSPVTLDAMRREPALAGMTLLRRGSRLSVQPVEPAEYRAVLKLA